MHFHDSRQFMIVRHKKKSVNTHIRAIFQRSSGGSGGAEPPQPRRRGWASGKGGLRVQVIIEPGSNPVKRDNFDP